MPRLAIVGNGERAARHLAACRRVEGIEVVAGALSGSADYQELLGREEIDAVDVCAPPGAAAEIAVAVARDGKQVVVEYLPGTSEAEVEAVIAACQEAGVSLHLLRPGRYQPLPREIKATLAAGKLGSLRYAHAASIWHGEGSGEAEDFTSEYATGTLDLLAWFFEGTPLKTVFARDCSLGESGSASRYVSVVLFFADTSQAIGEVGLTSSFAANTGLQRLALTGLRGSAYFTERDSDVFLGSSGLQPLVDEPVDGLATAFAAWVAGSGADKGDQIEEGRRTSRLVLAAAESLRTGQPVEVG